MKIPMDLTVSDYLYPQSYSFVRFLGGYFRFVGLMPYPIDQLANELMSPGHRPFPKRFLTRLCSNIGKADIHISEIPLGIEEELLLCDKSVYFASLKDVVAYRDNLALRYPWSKPFHISTDYLYGGVMGWTFKTVSDDRIVTTFKRLLDSGIYGRLVIAEKRNAYQKSRNATREIEAMIFAVKSVSMSSMKVSLNGSIQTVFIGWIYAIPLCVGVLISEFIFSKLKNF